MTCSTCTFVVCVCVCASVWGECVRSLWHSLERTTPANETRWIYFRQLLDGLQVLQLSVRLACTTRTHFSSPRPIRFGLGAHPSAHPTAVLLTVCVHYKRRGAGPAGADSFMRPDRRKSRPLSLQQTPPAVYYSLIAGPPGRPVLVRPTAHARVERARLKDNERRSKKFWVNPPG